MNHLVKNDVKTCKQLVEEYKFNRKAENPEKIHFSGVGDQDVYNITAPFEDVGQLVIAGRVEARDSEHSQVQFFIEQNGKWIVQPDSPVFQLQDPFFTRIGGELVLGGVQIFPHPVMKDALGWRTVFYKGENIAGLKEFAVGPDGMKDIRLVELKDGTVGVFTRPQGDKGGRGKIGFAKVAKLDELTIDFIESVPLLEGQFTDEEWGGANEAHLLSNGLIGVLGHIASFDDAGDRHYYPMIFVINPENGEYSDIQLIAMRENFLPGEAKRSDLVDVVFSGGLVRQGDGKAELYAGISDAEAQKVTIADPFLPFEAL
ncbi:MTP-1 family protein [Metabacillus idriensis]|uniref:MTP-1 family protein n=1 Tax=Metabacillus idriensis TaxID=324768 RepID=UPI003D2CA209